MDSPLHVIKRCVNPRLSSSMASYALASTNVIKRCVNPRFLRQMASYDVASTVHQSFRCGLALFCCVPTTLTSGVTAGSSPVHFSA